MVTPDENEPAVGVVDAADLEQALTMLAWSDPSFADDPAAAMRRLGVDTASHLRLDVRIRRPDTLYLIIPPASPDGGTDTVVNQMDLWRSGEQFVWIMPQDAKLELLTMREQFRDHAGKEQR